MPDATLTKVIKQYLAELPDAERQALLADVTTTPSEPKPVDGNKGLARGREAFKNGRLSSIQVETEPRDDYSIDL